MVQSVVRLHPRSNPLYLEWLFESANEQVHDDKMQWLSGLVETMQKAA
jgi:hypothetical protein